MPRQIKDTTGNKTSKLVKVDRKSIPIKKAKVVERNKKSKTDEDEAEKKKLIALKLQIKEMENKLNKKEKIKSQKVEIPEHFYCKNAKIKPDESFVQSTVKSALRRKGVRIQDKSKVVKKLAKPIMKSSRRNLRSNATKKKLEGGKDSGEALAKKFKADDPLSSPEEVITCTSCSCCDRWHTSTWEEEERRIFRSI